MITLISISIIILLSISITFLVLWQVRERRFMLFESLLCVAMAVIIFDVLTKFLIV